MSFFDDLDFLNELDNNNADENPGQNNDNKLNKDFDKFENIKLDSENLENIVNFYFEEFQYDKALKYINILLQHYPYSSEGYHKKALILDSLG